MKNQSAIKVRAAIAADETFISGLVHRLTEFGVPEWRDPATMYITDCQILTQKIRHPGEDSAVFIAEDLDDGPLGFIHVHVGTDYYKKEPHGHLSVLIIAPAGEGRGVAKVLIERAEAWCRQKGFHWLSLSVFYQNIRARQVYKHLGFGEDVMKYVR